MSITLPEFETHIRAQIGPLDILMKWRLRSATRLLPDPQNNRESLGGPNLTAEFLAKRTSTVFRGFFVERCIKIWLLRLKLSYLAWPTDVVGRVKNNLRHEISRASVLR